jgi:hypothetical protein
LLLGQVIASAWTTLSIAAHTSTPRARGFKAGIANLLFEPTEITILMISTATTLQLNPHRNSEAGLESRPPWRMGPAFLESPKPPWAGEMFVGKRTV